MARCRRTWAAAGTVALLSAACDTPAHPPKAFVPTSVRFPATVTIELSAESDAPLELKHFVQLSSDVLVAVERKTDVVWRLPLRRGEAIGAIGSLRGQGRRTNVGLAALGGALTSIDVTGRIAAFVTETASWRDVTRRYALRGSGLRSFIQASDGAWYLLENHASVDPMTRLASDTLRVVRLDSTGSVRVEYAHPRASPDRLLGFMADLGSLTIVDDTLLLASSSPPRVRRWALGATHATFETLTGVPVRMVDSSDRQAITRQLAAVGPAYADAATAFDRYPPVYSARPVGRGLFVVATAGLSRFALDYYCRDSFVATLIDHPAAVSIALVDEGAVVMRDDLERDRMLVEYYDYRRFGMVCR